MSTFNDLDRRIGDWLEEGAQTIPDRLVETALEQAHATSQVGAGIRLPWVGRPRPVSLGRLVSVAVGALAGLAVVAAFGLGIMFAPQVGHDQPTPSPSSTPAKSEAPPGSVVARPINGLQAIDVLPGEPPDFYALIGLAATRDAVWTVVATGDSAGRLVRIDAATGEARQISIPDANGMLSPPTADGDVVWTGSGGGLHRVDASGIGTATVPLSFLPSEIGVSADGLWVAREGGTSLVDPETGQVLREIEAARGNTRGRIIGPPMLGSFWACAAARVIELVEPADGSVTATVDLPAGSDCQGRAFEVAGIEGLGNGVIPFLSSVVIDPVGSVSSEFDVGAWSDVIEIDARLWFLEILRDRSGTLALIELDPATRRPAQILTFEGAYHLNTSFESGYVAIAGDFLWLLVDPSPAEVSDVPQIVRVPLSELR